MSCPDCFTGSVHEGTPRGEIVQLHGLAAYAVGPADGRPPQAVLVVVPDALGWAFVNSRLLADRYADKGPYQVYLPDFTAGAAAPESLLGAMKGLQHDGLVWKPYNLVRVLAGLLPFLYTNRIGKSFPRVRAFFEALRVAQGPDAKIAAAGFCWGGKHVLLLAHNVTTDPTSPSSPSSPSSPAPLINVGFVGHPSFVTLPDDVDETMTVPVSLAMGELEPNLTPAQVEQMRVAVEETLPPPARGELRVYPGAGHGFCVRADTSQNDILRQAAAAEDQCIAWCNKHLAVGRPQ